MNMATMIGRRVWCSAITMHQATVIREVPEIGWEVAIDGWGKRVCGAHSLHMTDADAIRQLENEEFCARHTREQIERGELSTANNEKVRRTHDATRTAQRT